MCLLQDFLCFILHHFFFKPLYLSSSVKSQRCQKRFEGKEIIYSTSSSGYVHWQHYFKSNFVLQSYSRWRLTCVCLLSRHRLQASKSTSLTVRERQRCGVWSLLWPKSLSHSAAALLSGFTHWALSRNSEASTTEWKAVTFQHAALQKHYTGTTLLRWKLWNDFENVWDTKCHVSIGCSVTHNSFNRWTSLLFLQGKG